MVPPVIGRRKTLLGLAGAAGWATGLSIGEPGSQSGEEQDGTANRPHRGDAPGFCDVAVPDDHETIQAAVDAADEGDTVCVQPGTYSESVTIDTADLTLQSTESRGATIDARGSGTGVRLEADGITVAGFEIIGDSDTTSGISINTSAGATRDLTIRDNHIHGMSKPGGGGVVGISSWGILSFGDQSLRGVTVNRNTIEEIGGDDDKLPIGIGIDLEEVEGESRREGAVVFGNTIRHIADASTGGVLPKEVADLVPLDVESLDIRLPGVGVAIQPLDGESSGAGAAATDVHRNVFEDTSVDVVMGDVGFSRVFNNETES